MSINTAGRGSRGHLLMFKPFHFTDEEAEAGRASKCGQRHSFRISIRESRFRSLPGHSLQWLWAAASSP